MNMGMAPGTFNTPQVDPVCSQSNGTPAADLSGEIWVENKAGDGKVCIECILFCCHLNILHNIMYASIKYLKSIVILGILL